MENLRGLSPEVFSARKLLAESMVSYQKVGKRIGVSKSMVEKVMRGERTSARVVAGAVALAKESLGVVGEVGGKKKEVGSRTRKEVGSRRSEIRKVKGVR